MLLKGGLYTNTGTTDFLEVCYLFFPTSELITIDKMGIFNTALIIVTFETRNRSHQQYYLHLLCCGPKP